ncbi:hypothetical protein BOX15_Mlig028744g2 [Macrostomum lignano]|uniref:Transmembrane protein n=1 Tax=Macrostomum lignano TaxID=282301 RepID=A0A267GME9_9PLAT|nr:hypothetical protein BOX15_Mlig028744g2 [Macrostomum lignano]
MQTSLWTGSAGRGGGGGGSGGGSGRRPSSVAGSVSAATGGASAGSSSAGGGFRFAHSEHSKERHRAENLSASRSLLGGSGDIGGSVELHHPASAAEAHLAAGCPRLRVLRLAEPPPPSSNSATPTPSTGGRTLTPPSFLLTLPNDTVDGNLANYHGDEDDDELRQLQQLRQQRQHIEASIRSLAASVASSTQQQLAATGCAESAAAELHVDSRLTPDSPEEQRRVRRKKLRQRALVGVYLTAVLLAVLAVVFLAAKGVFYTAGVTN